MQQFNNHISNFKRWLELLNYAKTTIYNDPKFIRNFLEYLEATGIKTIQEIENRHIKEYYEYLKVRPNKRTSGALSQNTIISNMGTIKRFAKYLRENHQENITINIKTEHIKTDIIILSKAEIQALYRVCKTNTLGIRDRAMLSIYYGCGLRRTEGTQLNTEDILFNKSIIFIKKGKGNRQRYVPMSEQVRKDLKNYINIARNYLIKDKNENALFLTYAGKRIGGTGMITRLKTLSEKAKLNKEPGLHTLRHSIATHLLQSGMSLENISQFLGHHSLESTQIYTHLKLEI